MNYPEAKMVADIVREHLTPEELADIHEHLESYKQGSREWEADVLDQLAQLRRDLDAIKTELESLETFTIRSRDQDN